MNINDAMNLLGLSGTATQKDIAKAYKRMAIKYHPDKNPSNGELMKAINAAYNYLKGLDKDVSFDTTDNKQPRNYHEELSKVLEILMGLDGLSIELCGNWVWISGNTKEHKETLKELKCKWAKNKKMWFFRPDDYKSKNRKAWNMDQIRDEHGSQYMKSTKTYQPKIDIYV